MINFIKKDPFLCICFLGLFLFITGNILHYFLVYHDYRIEHIKYNTPVGSEVEADLYIPSNSNKPPVVIPCHGVISTKEMLHSFSIEMCRNGYAVLVPDLQKPLLKIIENVNFVDYIIGAIDYIEKRPDLDCNKIAIMGHSWGGDIAYSSGVRCKNIKTVISFGMSIYTVPSLSPSILLACGAYDLLHPPWEMLSSLRESSGIKEQKFFETCGNTGSERKLVISPLTDHSSEILDPLLIQETVKWLDFAFSYSREEKAQIEYLRIAASNLRNSGFFLSFYYLSYFTLLTITRVGKINMFPFIFNGSILIMILIMKVLYSHIPYFFPDMSLILLHIIIITGFFFTFFKINKSENNLKEKYIFVLKFIVTYSILLWSSVIISIMILRLPFFIVSGWMLKYFHMILFKFFTDGYFYFCKMESLFGLIYGHWSYFLLTVIPLIFIETFKPGIIIRTVINLSFIFLKKRTIKSSGKENTRKIYFMIILFFCAVIAWINLITRGISVRSELILGLLWLLFQNMVLPLIFIVIFYRIFSGFSWFPKIKHEQ